MEITVKNTIDIPAYDDDGEIVSIVVAVAQGVGRKMRRKTEQKRKEVISRHVNKITRRVFFFLPSFIRMSKCYVIVKDGKPIKLNKNVVHVYLNIWEIAGKFFVALK
jgi:hypothetical protein